MESIFVVTILTIFYQIGTSNCAITININQHSDLFKEYSPTPESDLLREDKSFWDAEGRNHLEKILQLSNNPHKHVAKNVIIMIGDGMGIPTITSARIYQGQREFGKSGEDHSLAFDHFPNVALVKTYNVDMQVPDSAATATAILTGIKTRYQSLGVDVRSNKTHFDRKVYEESRVESVMTWAQRGNKSTGIITTTRITHATPAAAYAQINFRKWECDSKIPENIRPEIKDIARQLIEEAPGKNFKVIMGGGFQQLGHITNDQSGENECVRTDNRNLTKIWLEMHKNDRSAFITNNQDLSDIKASEVDYLLGLFHPDHLPYELLRDKSAKGTPSLSDMVKKGLPILQKDPNGFILLIEGGRIDLGHHDNYARLALEEASELDRTLRYILANTDDDTLILLTADHSHSMTLNGYSKRGNDILGYTISDPSDDKKPSLTLTYSNGPGFNYHYLGDKESSILEPWRDVRSDINRLNDAKYRHLGAFELDDETHGGEDVALYAIGPGAFLIRGVIEQNYIAHVVSYASCVGPRAALNPYCANKNIASANNNNKNNLGLLLLVAIIKIVFN